MSTSARPVIDVSALPGGALDHRSPIWWGNLLMIVIETVMFALLVATYFYLRGNFSQWPPVQSNAPIAQFDPVPALGMPTLNLGVILLSFLPMWWADRAALRMDEHAVRNALIATIAFGGVAIALRFWDFAALRFRWDDNAYASVVWMIAGMHLLHLIVGTCENFTMVAWIVRHGMDQKHARDVRVTAGYWYWIIGIWIVLYAIVYPGPRYF